MKVTPEEVVKFFESINPNPGNSGLVHTIRSIPHWELKSLSKSDFMKLECQTEPHKLLEKLTWEEFSVLRNDHTEKYKSLKSSKSLEPLIIRELYSTDMPNASYYLEDGTGRSMAIKKYIEESHQYGIKAYVGYK